LSKAFSRIFIAHLPRGQVEELVVHLPQARPRGQHDPVEDRAVEPGGKGRGRGSGVEVGAQGAVFDAAFEQAPDQQAIVFEQLGEGRSGLGVPAGVEHVLEEELVDRADVLHRLDRPVGDRAQGVERWGVVGHRALELLHERGDQQVVRTLEQGLLVGVVLV
jgi:hypothetical protein